LKISTEKIESYDVSANGMSIVVDLEGTSLCVIGLSFSIGCDGADSAAFTGGTTVNFMGSR
jgi:hypothetical protein